MPNFDKTGPAGQGLMTGQGLGPCSGNQQANMRGGRGCRMGFGGGGGGLRRGFSANSEVTLEDQEKILENKLEAIRKLKAESNSQK